MDFYFMFVYSLVWFCVICFFICITSLSVTLGCVFLRYTIMPQYHLYSLYVNYNGKFSHLKFFIDNTFFTYHPINYDNWVKV